MEALAAVGLASNIVQFLTFASDLLSKSKEISRSVDGALVEHSEIEAVTRSLHELSKGLVIPRGKGNDGSTQRSQAEEELRTLSKESQEVASMLLNALSEMRSHEHHGKTWRSFRQALSVVLNSKQIDELSTRLERYQKQINTALLISVREQIVESKGHWKASIELMAHEVRGVADANTAWRLELLEAVQQNHWQASRESDVQLFSARLLQSTQSERNNLHQRRIYDQLRFTEMKQRHQTIAAAHRETFEWVFRGDRQVPDSDSSPPETSWHQWDDFTSWLGGDSGTYWVTGKPGSGKSTLMKFLYDDPRTMDHIQAWEPSKSLICAGFFFWNSGSTMQMSFQGLLKSLLHQCLSGKLELIPEVLSERWEQHTLYGHDLRPFTWFELKTALLRLLSLSTYRFLIFVDGLDEFDKDPSELSDFLLEIGRHETLKLCVASRPWPIFEETFSQCPWLRLEDLTRPDIELYVERSLTTLPRWKALADLQSETASRLTKDIADKASGVFLWVILVVQSLIAGLRDGDTANDLMHRLEQLPPDLEDLFRKIIGQLTPEYLAQACELFRLVEGAIKPMSLLEASFAIEDYAANLDAPVQPLEPAELAFRAETVRRRISSRCKCLLEAQGFASKRHNATIEYFHRTVRDFIRSDEIQSYIHSSSSSFDPIPRLCGASLRLVKTLPKGYVSVLESFWEPTLRCILYAKMWEIEKDQAPVTLLDNLERAGDRYWGGMPTDPRIYDSWLEEIIDTQNMRSIDRSITLPEPTRLNNRGQNASTLSNKRSRLPHWTNTKYFQDLSNGIDPRSQRVWYRSFVHYMFEENYSSYVLAKLEEASTAHNTDLATGLLDRACLKPDFDMVRLLLRYGADPNLADARGSTPWRIVLWTARDCKGDREQEILYGLSEQFIEAGADLNTRFHDKGRLSSQGRYQPDRLLSVEQFLPVCFHSLGAKKVNALLSRVEKKKKGPNKVSNAISSIFKSRKDRSK